MSHHPRPKRTTASDDELLHRRFIRLGWRAVTVVFVGLAILGTVLPVMPTVPFLLVAAWSAGKGWPEFERWLLDHAHFGPPIRQWRENGAVPRRVKVISGLMMATSAVGMQFFGAIPVGVRIGVPLVMLAVWVWLWFRPEP